jgi:disulfide oxidoreductase YuzD
MKRLTFWIRLLLMVGYAGSVSGAGVEPITVQFVDPAKFTDFTIRGRDANYTAKVFADSVRDELTPILKQKYPNSNLVLRFTDIDLAGWYSAARDVRIKKGIHPIRMSFAFQLIDSSGKVLANGTTQLTDPANVSSGKYDPRRSKVFYFERRALNRWFRTLSVSR